MVGGTATQHLVGQLLCISQFHMGCLNSVEWWNGMKRNGMNAALATHVLQPTDDLILNCIQCFASWLSMCKVEMALINISGSN